MLCWRCLRAAIWKVRLNDRLTRHDRHSSDIVETAACRDEAAGHAQRGDCTMLFHRSDSGSIGLDAATDLDLTCRTARLDAQRDGGERDDNTLDQRRPGATECLNAAMHDQPADRLADLNADCAVRVGNNAVELREVDRAGIDIEAARTCTEGFDGSVDFQFMDDAAWTVRRDLGLGGPAINDASIVKHHVVDTVGYDRTKIAHYVDTGAVDREDAAGNLVRRAGRKLIRTHANILADHMGASKRSGRILCNPQDQSVKDNGFRRFQSLHRRRMGDR